MCGITGFFEPKHVDNRQMLGTLRKMGAAIAHLGPDDAGVPIGHWLRGSLREWAELLLDESRLRREGYFDPLLVRNKWAEHLSGKRNWQYHLWNILMFQVWLENERAN